MRKTLLLSLLWALPLFAVSPVNKTFFGSVAIEGYDPVAYFTDGKPIKGSKAFTLDWNGASWRFATAEHRALFEADPEKYVPQYGGYCAYAVAHGDTAGIDPDAWTLLDGKLYLNYSRKIQKDWEADRAHFIEEANRHWPELRDDPN